MGFLSSDQIKTMGFQSIGENVLLSDKASYYNCQNISIGNNTRIDDFAVLSAGKGGIVIGQHVHIAIGVSLVGAGKIILGDFSGLSSKVSVFSSNDDYSGNFMTGPTLSSIFTNVTDAQVSIGKHVIVGAGTVILPGVIIEEGCAVGALSLITKDCKEFGVYIGTPVKRIKERSRKIIEIERRFINKG